MAEEGVAVALPTTFSTQLPICVRCLLSASLTDANPSASDLELPESVMRDLQEVGGDRGRKQGYGAPSNRPCSKSLPRSGALLW